MKATIGLEHIGSNTHDMLRSFEQIERAIGIKQDCPRFGPFVAEVRKGPDIATCFRYLSGKRDYSKANSKGSRGIYVWYLLEIERLYFVHEPVSWKSSKDYYCTVNADGSLYKLNETEVKEWLSAL